MNNEIKKRLAQRLNASKAKSSGMLEIDIDLIDDNPYQPRLDYDEVLISELANSIKSEGLIHPVPISRDGERYTLIAGHRRVRAFKVLGKKSIPAIVYDTKSEQELIILSAIENLRRVDLTPVEEALIYEKMAKAGFSNKKIAKSLGASETAISRTRNLLKLDSRIISDIQTNKSTNDITALSLLRKISDRDLQVDLYFRFLKNGREWLKSEIAAILEAENKKGGLTPYEKYVKVGKRKIEITLSELDEKKREEIIEYLKRIFGH